MRHPTNASPLPFPVHMVPWAVARVRATRQAGHRAWGEPHFVERDGWRTAGGEEDNWAWELSGGTRLLVVLAAPVNAATIYCDPPHVAEALAALGIDPAVRQVEVFEKPVLDSCYTGPHARP
jgi:hypothetical protein